MKVPKITRLSDLSLFLNIGIWALAIPFILNVLSVQGAFQAITPRTPRKRDRNSMEKAIHYTEFWIKVIRRVTGATCYQRTAILYHCLRDQGLPVKIAIGVSDHNPLLGHSWLILRGKPFLEARKDLKKFKMSYVYP